MPDAGAYLNLKRLLVDSPIPLDLANHERLSRVTRMTGRVAPIAAIATPAILVACAVLLWLAPWPVDALVAVLAAVAWTAWIDKHESQ